VNYPGGRLFFLLPVLDVFPGAGETRLAGEFLEAFENVTHNHLQCFPAECSVLHGMKSGVFFVWCGLFVAIARHPPAVRLT
jgi:hypothetical protein